MTTPPTSRTHAADLTEAIIRLTDAVNADIAPGGAGVTKDIRTLLGALTNPPTSPPVPEPPRPVQTLPRMWRTYVTELQERAAAEYTARRVAERTYAPAVLQQPDTLYTPPGRGVWADLMPLPTGSEVTFVYGPDRLQDFLRARVRPEGVEISTEDARLQILTGGNGDRVYITAAAL